MPGVVQVSIEEAEHDDRHNENKAVVHEEALVDVCIAKGTVENF